MNRPRIHRLVFPFARTVRQRAAPWMAAVVFASSLVNGGARVTVFQADFEACSIEAKHEGANVPLPDGSVNWRRQRDLRPHEALFNPQPNPNFKGTW